MKQLSLFCLFVWAGLQPAATQITINNSVFPAVGDTLHYIFGNQAGAINQIFTPPGGPQQWDLGNLQPTQHWDQAMRNPQSGMSADDFPSASVLFHPLNSSAEAYWHVTGNQVLDLGYFGLDPLGLGLNLLFVRTPGLEVSWAPIQFFDIRQSTSNVLTAFDAPIAPPVLLNLVPTADSFRIRIAQQRLGSVDAFGSLTIPGGSFEVLRKKQTEYRSTAVDVKVAPLGWIDISTIGGQQLLPLGTDTITTFHFLNDLSKEAIAICTLNTAQNEVIGVQYRDLTVSSTGILPDSEPGMFAYPNPVGHTLFIEVGDADTGYLLRLMTLQGRTVWEKTAAGNLAVPASDLAPGVYLLIMERDGQTVARQKVVVR